MTTKTLAHNLLSRTGKTHAPLPGLDGYFLCRAGENSGRFSGPPVVERRTSSLVDCRACLRVLKRDNTPRAFFPGGFGGPQTGLPLIHAPRWTTDHHPWLVKGMDHETGIRYANHEVAEVSPR